MDRGNWKHVAGLEADAEREEFEKWTKEATIEQAELRGFGYSNLKLVDLREVFNGDTRLKLVKKGAMIGAKRGQIFHLCPTVGKQAANVSFEKSEKVAKGVVYNRNMGDELTLVLDKGQCEALMQHVEDLPTNPSLFDTYWDLCLEGCEVTNRLRFQLIDNFPNAMNVPADQREMIRRLEPAIFQPRYEPVDPRVIIPPADSIQTGPLNLPENFRFRHNMLNEPQIRAVANTLSKPVSCIHGPPGTGKTTTVSELIIELHSSQKKVLITGPSNISVDNVLRLCARNEEVRKSCVRLGHPARINPDLHGFTFDNLASKSDTAISCRSIRDEIAECMKVRAVGELKGLTNLDLRRRITEQITGAPPKPPSLEYIRAQVRAAARQELGKLREEVKTRDSKITQDMFHSHSLVFCTCAGSMRPELAKYVKQYGFFDYVIIDEAAKATVLDSLMPCLIGRRLILAGDHKQLRATVKSKEAEKIGLGFSLMERLINERVPSVMLQVQYRMNKQLMAWPSGQFYGAALEAAASVADKFLDEDTPGLYWCDTANVDHELFKETSGTIQSIRDPSKLNLAEAVIVRAYISNLLNKFSDISSIGVISFYTRQVKLLHQVLRDHKFENKGQTEICVETVDGFQGKEADVIILSMVRSNKNKEIGFLAEPTRINVSVTRARRHCAIIGDSKTVTDNEILGSLFDACRVETCLVQITHDEIVEETRKLHQFRQESSTPNKSTKASDGNKKKANLFRGSNYNARNQAGDLAFKQEITKKLKNLTSKNPSISFEGLTAFKRMVIHSIAGEMGLTHITKKIGDDCLELVVELPENRQNFSDDSQDLIQGLKGSTESSSTELSGIMHTRANSQKNRFQALMRSTSSQDDDESDDLEVMSMLLTGPTNPNRTMRAPQPKKYQLTRGGNTAAASSADSRVHFGY